MKKFLTLLVATLLSIGSLYAIDYTFVRIEKGIDLPVKLQTSRGVYMATSLELQINGDVTIRSAHDANGKVMVVQGSVSVDENGKEARLYDVTKIYKEPEVVIPDKEEDKVLTQQELAENFGAALGRAIYIPEDGFPYVGIEIGHSGFCTNFVRARYARGSTKGFLFYGGLGKLGLFRKDLGDDVYWHLGSGFYLSDELNTVEFGMVFGSTAMPNNVPDEPAYKGSGLAVELDARYGYFLPNTRVGLFGGVGIGAGFPKEGSAKLLLDLQLGVVVRLFTDWD